MRRLSALAICIGSALLGLTLVNCTMTISPMPVEDAKAQTLAALNALQAAWQQAEPDAATLQSQAARVRERLTVLCRPYLSLAEGVDAATTPLTARQAQTPIVPQSATPSTERPSPESTQERQETLEQSHLAPDPAVLQARRANLAAAEHCQRAMNLLMTIDAALAAQDFATDSFADILAELRAAVEQLPETPLP